MAETKMRVLANISGLIIGFVAIVAILSARTSDRYVPTVTEKLSRYAAVGDNYDVLLIGSSRTYRQLIPTLIDQATAAAGKPTRTFNFGIDGMFCPEDSYVLEKALALRKKPLRLVIVECSKVSLAIRPADIGTVRALHWHDWKRFSTLCRMGLLGDTKKRKSADAMRRRNEVFLKIAEHADYWFRNVTQFGRGNELISEKLFGISNSRMLVGTDGFRDAMERRPLSGQELADYGTLVDAARTTPLHIDYAEWVSQAELMEKRRIIERAGAKMILIIPPYPATKRFLPSDPKDQASVLDFSNPLEFPELYTPEHRLDEGHTNRAGSEIYTRLVAEKILPQL